MVTIIGMGTILGILVILRIFKSYGMVTFLKDCNNSKGQGHLMIFDHPRDGDLPKMVSALGMATIIGMMANDQSRDGGHPWDRLEDSDHFGEGDLHRDSDHP